MRRGVRLALLVFFLTWIPATLFLGLRFGSTMRIGADGRKSVTPLIEGVIQLSWITLVPAMVIALLALAIWGWMQERRAGSRHGRT